MQLVNHLNSEHDSQISIMKHHFNSWNEFETWKATEESLTKSFYARDSSAKLYGSSRHYYFYCNRSGDHKCKGHTKRQLKLQGSSKTKATCVAHIKAIQDTTTDHVAVEYCSVHNSHDMKLSHLPIPNDIKLTIAAKLQDGVDIDRILDDVHDSFTSPGVGRQHLVNKQDIHNIKRKLNLQCIQKHQNDLISVRIWVQELKALHYNPVVVFKEQGKCSSDEQPTTLAQDTFLLGIQTEYQCDAMRHFGNKLICMDSTHGTNLYDFLLISVIVIDEYGEGVPVAWAISNHEHTAVLVQFLEAIKSRTGELHPQIFMSDDAEQFYTAWCTVYNDTPSKLLCMWHIDRSWRKSLKEHVEKNECRIELYHHLRVLLLEQDKTQFQLQLQKFMSHLHTNYFRYYEYFKRTYVGRCEQWAASYRIGCIVNTNMFAESFHRLLKIVYLEGKQNRRVDKLLNTLLRIARNLIYEQISKEEKGKMSHRLCEIVKRHKTAIEMVDSCTVLKESEVDPQWKVQSQTNEASYYIIIQLCTNCSCKLNCSHCGACIHMYSCSCIDYALHSTVCKHIHLVHMHVTSETKHHDLLASDAIQGDTAQLDSATAMVEPAFNTSEYFSSVLHKEQQDRNIKKSKAEINNMLQSIKATTECNSNQETLEVVKRHLQCAIFSIEAYKQNGLVQDNDSFKQTTNPPPNACSKKQPRFFSTKKKPSQKTTRMKKPSAEEQQTSSKLLQSMESNLCAICWKEDDDSDNDDVQWVSCSKCELWMHKSCVKSDMVNSNDYFCQNCYKI